MTRRSFRIAFEILAGLVAGMAIIIGVGIWRLSSGPVDLAFLTPYVEAAINSEGSPVRVKIRDTVLSWGGWERAIDIVARNVEVAPADAVSRPVAVLPEVSFNLSLHALVKGEIAPTSLEILYPAIALRRLPSGAFGLSLQTGNDPEGEAPEGPVTPIDRLLGDIGTFLQPPQRDHVLGYLKRLSIVGAKASYRDYHLDRNWRLSGAAIDLIRDDEGVELKLGGRLQQGGHSGTIHLSAAKPFTSDTGVVMVQSVGIEVGLLDGLIPGLTPGDAANDRVAFTFEAAMRTDGMPLNWTLDVASDGLGDITSSGLTINTDTGVFQASLEIDGVSPAKWAGLTPQLGAAAALDSALSGKISILGRMETYFAGLSLDQGDISITGKPGRLTLNDIYDYPLEHNGLALEASFAQEFGQAEITKASLDLPEGFMQVSGHSNIADGKLNLDLSGELTGFNMAHLGKLWPVSLGRDARAWVVPNIPEGPVPRATIGLKAEIGDDGSVTLQEMGGEITLDEGVVHYFRPLPPATKVSGVAKFGPDWFDIDVKGGEVGDLKISKGGIKIIGIGTDDLIEIDLDMAGPFREALELVDHKPLKLVSGIGFDTATVSGTAKGHVRFDFPLLNDLKAEQVRVKVGAELENLTMEKAFRDEAAHGEALKMTVDNDGFNVAGEVRVAGIPLIATWQENFSGSAKLRKRLTVNGRVDETALARIGYNLIPYLDGVADINLESREFRNGRSEIDLAANLEGAGLIIPPLNWMKPRTVPASLSLAANWTEGGPVNILPVEFKSDTLSLSGSASLGADQETIRQVLVDKMVLNGADIAGSAVRQEKGDYVVDIRGEYIDISGILDMLDSGGGQPDDGKDDLTPPFVANAHFGVVTAGFKRRLLDASLSVQHDGSHLQYLNMQAKAKDGSPLAIRYGLGDQGYELIGSMENAGAALRSIDAFDGIEGGRMTISGARPSEKDPLVGRVEMSNFVLVKAPAMAKVLEFMSLTGTLNALTSTGLPFSRMQADYSLQDSILTLRKAKVFGDSIGVSLSGDYDVKRDRINASGTVVPAYAINRAIGAIPLVGWILTGGEDGGFFGANYSVSGPLEDPQVTVNPLSALTPGVLRRLFDIFPNQPSDEEEERKQEGGKPKPPPNLGGDR